LIRQFFRLTIWAVALGLLATALSAEASGAARNRSTAISPIHHYLYVFPPGSIAVYDIDHGFHLAKRFRLPATAIGVRGAAVHAATNALYLSIGGYGGRSGRGSLLRYDLVTNRVRWLRHYPFGVDSLAITPSGSKIYLPTGEDSTGDRWEVIRPSDGAVIGVIHADHGPHDTVVSLNGRHVYLAGRGDRYLLQASTKTDRVVKRIGRLLYGIRPFTITGRETFAFVNEEHLLGFQVCVIGSGRVLYTVKVRGFHFSQSISTPSHGIALSPDEKRLWLIDRPNDFVHLFGVSRLPHVAPHQLADIHLRGNLHGKSAWLGMSRDGHFLFVAAAGDVIDTRTEKTVRVLPALTHAKVYLEIDFRNGVPIFATSREAVGYRQLQRNRSQAKLHLNRG
jgi:DNA-binding beta-propeller fold protein YncE